jgi:adenosylcobinamide amidohydrolase
VEREVMPENLLVGDASLEHTLQHVHVEFTAPRRVISSAVLNGGLIKASHLVNVRVPKYCVSAEPPEVTLSKYCADAGWSGTSVGMMTAASMDSFRVAREVVDGVEIAVLVTSGLSNPRRAGDRAEYREIASQSEPVGTINIIAMTSAILTDAALVEALMIVTEAKSAALQEVGVRSPVSNKTATGTGTDALAVVSGHGPETVRYCGKHVLFGEVLGRLVADAVTSSSEWAES